LTPTSTTATPYGSETNDLVTFSSEGDPPASDAVGKVEDVASYNSEGSCIQNSQEEWHGEDCLEQNSSLGFNGKCITVMIKNIPCKASEQDILNGIESVGFLDHMNFFYLPRKNASNLGYAFVGFPDPKTTEMFAEAMTGFRFTSQGSPKIVNVVPARVQGVRKCKEHFRSRGRFKRAYFKLR